MKALTSLRALAVLLLAALALAACGGDNYKTDVPVADLQSALEPLIEHADHLDTADADYLRFNFAGTDAADERLVRLPVSGTTLDEYGIFRAASADGTAALADACEAYLQTRNDAWLGLYLVEEYPKLRDAEVKVIGNYVVYLILSEDEKAAVIEKIEETLK
ncbi:MAG: DUF4358 domain-containing protein [Clostridia bacterium]|nr:DUF4358 domain-containing protein [Clostridia bacterium]